MVRARLDTGRLPEKEGGTRRRRVSRERVVGGEWIPGRVRRRESQRPPRFQRGRSGFKDLPSPVPSNSPSVVVNHLGSSRPEVRSETVNDRHTRPVQEIGKGTDILPEDRPHTLLVHVRSVPLAISGPTHPMTRRNRDPTR